MFFIINRCSFSGATLSGGFSFESSTKRFTVTSIERISKLQLDRLTITNMDFEEFFNILRSSVLS
jgi:DNA adenine methylase